MGGIVQVAGWWGCPGCVFGIEGSLWCVSRGGTAWKWYGEGVFASLADRV